MDPRRRSAKGLPARRNLRAGAAPPETIVLSQSSADAATHTLLLDQISIGLAIPAKSPQLPAPRKLEAEAFERHVDISWQPVESPYLQYYEIYRSLGDAPFQPIGIQEPGLTRFADFLGQPGQAAVYKVYAIGLDGRSSTASNIAAAAAHDLTDGELLSMLQEECFHYYWDSSGPHSGMTRENIPGDDRIVATGASGFGIMALMVGVDRSSSLAISDWSGSGS